MLQLLGSSVLTQSQLVSTQSAGGTSKPRCTELSCKRIGTASCSYKKCKPCCERSPTICQFKGHNPGGQRPVSVSDNPAHLARPIPSAPLHLLSTYSAGFSTSLNTLAGPSSENVTVSTGIMPPFVSDGFTFKKPVPKALSDDYLRRCKEREHRQQLELSRTENQRRINHSVILVAYLDDDTSPLMIPLQDISTWPTLNLVQVPDLSDILGVTDLLGLELYVPKNGFWTTNLDFAMTVKTDVKVYVRKRGIRAGPDGNPPISLSTSITPRTSRKRRLDSPPFTPFTPLSKLARIDSGVSDLDSESRLSSPALSLVSSPAAFGSEAFTRVLSMVSSHGQATGDNMDQNWALGFVHTPLEAHIVWPNGIYVRDMAKAFEMLAPCSQRLQERFLEVFQGKPWKESTYHKNQSFWMKLPVHIRQQAGNLPRTEDGIWTKWRKTQPGWA